MMWSLRHCFNDTLGKMKSNGLQEPTMQYHDLQTSSSGSSMCNHAQQEKGTFQWHEIYQHDSAQQLLKKGSVL